MKAHVMTCAQPNTDILDQRTYMWHLDPQG